MIARSSWYSQDREQVVSICLDTKYRLKSFSLVSIGTVNESLAHPREIFRPAIADGAYAVIVAHNHPSGDSSPSQADMALAKRLYWAADLLQIRFLDFIVIGDSDYFSVVEGTDCWPPLGVIGGQMGLSDSCYSPTLDSRLTRLYATGKQWPVIKKQTHPTGLLLEFLATASRSQLRRLRNLTPLFFDSSEPPGYFVCARDFRSTDTREWQQAKSARALIMRKLRHSGVGGMENK